MGTMAEFDWLMEPRRAPRHWALAWSAVLASMAVHTLIVLRMPPLTLVRPAPFEGRKPRPPVAVQDIRREPPPPSIERPEEFAPERPDASFGTRAPREFISALDPALLEPRRGAGALTGDLSPLRPPDAPPTRSEWIPRQERLEITKQVVREDPAAPPRRLEDAIPRIAQAPDIIPPSPPMKVEAPAGGIPGAGLPGDGLFVASRAGGDGMSSSAPPVDRPPVTAPPVEARDVAKVLNEKVPDVTEVRPIEQMLNLQVLTYRAAEEPDALYFSLRIERATPDALPVLPKDVLFVQDASESMRQSKVDECKKGLHAALKTLGPEDRFDVMVFREQQWRCFKQWTPATPEARAQAGWFIEKMESRGKTDVYGSLEVIRGLPAEPGRITLAVLLSDGLPTIGLMDNFTIIQSFTDRNDGRISVFSFGGGSKVNRFLLDFVSYMNRGDSRIVRELPEMAQGIAGFAAGLQHPLLAELSFRFSGVDESEIYPRRLTHLYLDRPLVVYGRVPAGSPAAGVQITGRSTAGVRDMVYRLDWSAAQPGPASIRTEWTWQKLAWLVGEQIRTRNPATLEEIKRLAPRIGPEFPYAEVLGPPAR